MSFELRLSVSPRAKSLRLRVDRRTGEVVLTVPRRESRRRALAWAEGQRDWIEARLAEVAPAVPFAPGAGVPLYGEPHRIDWDPGRPRTPTVAEGRLIAGGPREGLEARLGRWLRRHALDLLAAETAEFAAAAGVRVTRVGSATRCRAGAAARRRARSATAGGSSSCRTGSGGRPSPTRSPTAST